jgi:hypothetical protein
MCLQGSPNLADALQRQLVREPTPSLKLLPPEVTASPAATAATAPGAHTEMQLWVAGEVWSRVQLWFLLPASAALCHTNKDAGSS